MEYKEFKKISKGFNLINDDDKDLLNLKQFTNIINKFFHEGKIVSLKARKQKKLLKTVIKKGAPKIIRAHAYMIFFGGFHHLKGQRYEHSVDFHEILKQKLKYSEDDLVTDTINQIDKDLMRTHFPQEEKIRKYEKLWGVQLRTKGFYSLSKLKEESELFEDQNKGVIAKDIQKYMSEIEELNNMARNVLFVYSMVDSEVGYVQGMNSIASCIVYNVWAAKKEANKLSKKLKQKEINMESKLMSVFGSENSEELKKKLFNPIDHLDIKLEFTEEECFYIFYGLMKYSNQRKFFDNGLNVLQSTIADFELYLSHELPLVHKKMCCDFEVIT